MVLTNAERQARYRERIKALAAKAEMTETQAQLLYGARCRLRQWKLQLAKCEAGEIHLTRNRIDITVEHAAQLRGQIAEGREFLRQFDPEDRTRDNDIEFGEVSPNLASELWPGRAVTYTLDPEGFATDLRVFPSDSAAAFDASQEGRHAGWLSDDIWSITNDPRAGGSE
jgi:hypothetical protein